MPRESPMPRSDAGDEDERDGLATLRAAAPRLLKSLTDQTLDELVRILLAASGAMAAVVVWGLGSWPLHTSARWASGLDGLETVWAGRVLGDRVPIATLRDGRVGAYAREAAAVSGLVGGLLGFAGGTAGGLISRSIRRAARVGGAGALLGAVAGGAICLLIVPVAVGLTLHAPDARISIASRGLIFAASAAACGLAAGLGARAGLRETLKLTAAGTMGGGLGALLFELIQVFYFPFEPDFVPVPRSSLCRLASYGCATIIAAICVATVLASPTAPKPDGEA